MAREQQQQQQLLSENPLRVHGFFLFPLLLLLLFLHSSPFHLLIDCTVDGRRVERRTHTHTHTQTLLSLSLSPGAKMVDGRMDQRDVGLFFFSFLYENTNL